MAVKPISILYEDDDILAIDKPAGIMAHPDGRSAEPTVSDWVAEKYPQALNVGEPMKLATGEVIKRPGIVHRLDRETSGVMLIAKTADAFAFLKKQFQDRGIAKTYNALVYGALKDANGTIDLPIGRSQADFRKRSAERGARGDLRPAVTDYSVLASNADYSWLELHPHTGRTHQIRVHVKALQHPVVCDALYAPNRECPAVAGRLMLHARAIEFDAPNGEHLKIEAPLPLDMTAALEALLPEFKA